MQLSLQNATLNTYTFSAKHCSDLQDGDVDIFKRSCPKIRVPEIRHCGNAHCRYTSTDPKAWSNYFLDA
jgi:hypothetical protein